ncbi:MAG: hypothetical protein F6K19_32830 [Cyanothece sp. SIO1E1]|nr:hypothetical protein [Cyanothece sp. SIO1E1]
MRLKLDENLGKRTIELFQTSGHDVTTVLEQDLSSASDQTLIGICRSEDRALVTLDLDFSNPILFTPSDYPGIAVLRLPNRPTPQDLHDAARTLIGGLAQADIIGKLWIIQRAKIREYQEE